VAQLCHYTDELAQLGTEVLLVSFSSQGYAHRWIEETCSPFHLLLDREREVYRAYGLGSSLLRSWSPKIVWSYIKFLTSGRKWRGIQGNSAQLGGDFIIDAGGIVRLAYRSRDPADRPAVEKLMDILRRMEPERE
jgi:peroxiredoxin